MTNNRKALAKFQGLEVHERTCPVERRRSDLFVSAIERREDPWAAVATWQRAGRP
jgi:hypothetical protein